MASKTTLLFGWMVFLTFTGKVCASEALSHADSLGTVPMLMREHMKKIGCTAIRNFYSNYMVTEPPFLWLNSSGFALVCERQDTASRFKYALMIKADRGKHPFGSCPENVHIAIRPGGLLLEVRKIFAGDFVKLADNKPFKSTSGMEFPVLSVSTGTGGYVEYTCIGGDWYFNSYS